MRQTTRSPFPLLCITASILLVGCPDSAEDGDGTRIDEDLSATASLIRLSAIDPEGSITIVGLAGALPAGAHYELRLEGTEAALAEGVAREDGSFAVRFVAPDGRPVLRPLAADGESRGPDLPLNPPAGAAIRPPTGELLGTINKTGGLTVVGLLGSVPAKATVLVAALGTGHVGEATATETGDFEVQLGADAGPPIAVFVHPTQTTEDASVAVIVRQEAGFPVLITTAKSAASGVLLLGAPGSVQPGSTVAVTRGETAVPVASLPAADTGAYGGCAAEVTAGLKLHFAAVSATGAAMEGERAVPASMNLSSVLNPSFSSDLFADRVTLKGTVTTSIAHTVLVNCETGEWTRAQASTTGEVVLLIDAQPGDLLGVAGLGKEGEVGAAQFLLAGQTASEITLPIPRPDETLIAVSSEDAGSVIVAGWTSAPHAPVLPGARLEVVIPPATVHAFDAAPDGSFATRVPGVTPGTTLELYQAQGPFRSKPLALPVTKPDESVPTSPVAALISVLGGTDGVAVSAHPLALPPTQAVVANITSGDVRVVEVLGEGVDQTLAGGQDDEVAVFAIYTDDLRGGRHIVRMARPWDEPFAISAPGSLGCAVGLPGSAGSSASIVGSDGAAVAAAELVSDGDGGGWSATFEGAGVPAEGALQVSDASGQLTERRVPAADALDLSGLDVVATPDGIILGNGNTNMGSDWIIAIGAADGRSGLARPPHGPPWTKATDLVAAGTVRLFAIHGPTGAATGCIELELTIEIPDPPTIAAVVPDLLIVGGSFFVSGENLDDADVAVGGVQQELTSMSDTSLQGVVAEDTPLGEQTLTVTTLGGEASAKVVVASPPVVESVDPSPLIIGKTGVVVGAHFGATPTVTISGVEVTVLEVSESELTVLVVPTVPTGLVNMKVSNDVGSETVTVEVVCMKPTIDTVEPTSAFLGGLTSISGDHLLGATVTIAGIPQTISEETDTTLTVLIDAATPLGGQTLSASTGCGLVEAPLTVASAAPVIDGTTPDPAVVNQELNVFGDHLSGAIVTLGGVSQTLTIDSKKGLAFIIAPATPLGAQTLTIGTFGGEASATLTVKAPPVIDQVQPTTVSAGDELKIFGAHLAGGLVEVGGVPTVMVKDTGTLLAVTVDPDTPAGSQGVTVTTDAGTASAVVEVIAPPKITLVTPNPVNVGKILTIKGKNLDGGAVTIGGLAQIVVESSPTTLLVDVSTETPLGAQTLTVTTTGGDASTSLTTVLGPAINTVSPDPLVVGKSFVIGGKLLAGDPVSVTIGGVPQTILTTSDVEITGAVVVGTPQGTQDLKVQNDKGLDVVSVLVVGAPKVTGVNPDPVLAGDELVIVGLGLAGSTVTIGGVEATIVSASPTKLVVVVAPSTMPGKHDLIVSNPAGEAPASVTVLVPPPVITEVTPNPAFVDEKLVITGLFLHQASVSIADIPAKVLSASYDKVVCSLGATTPFDSGLKLLVTTPGGTAETTIDVSDGTPPGPPQITGIEPPEALPGTQVTVMGVNLKGASVNLAGKNQSVVSNTNASIGILIAAGTEQGTHDLQATTVKGTATASFTVLAPAPEITSVSPNPVKIGDVLTVKGKSLANFTAAKLGGVTQNLFYSVTNTKLTFKVLAGTPTGPGQPFELTTPGGMATAIVEVLPASSKPPEIFDVEPGAAAAGDEITITGDGLTGATFTIGSVPHSPLPGSTDFLVKVVLSALVPPGLQTVEASKPDVDSSTAELYVKPEAPLASLVYVSAISEKAQLAVVGLPGAVNPGALVNIGYGIELKVVTANEDGAFGLLLEGVLDGDTIDLAQGVEGFLSPSLTRTATPPADGAPVAPHPFLLRVEATPDGAAIYGPPPTFGKPEALIIALSGDAVAFETAGTLHGDASKGLLLSVEDLGEPVAVFAASADAAGPASEPVQSFAVSFDPPMVASAITGNTACVASLPGTVGTEVNVGLLTSAGGPVAIADQELDDAPDGSFTSRAILAGAPVGELFWGGLVDENDVLLSVPAALGTSISTLDVAASWAGGTLTVTATGIIGADDLFIVASPEGEAGAAFGDELGDATVALTTKSDVAWVWTISLSGETASGCLVVTTGP